MKFIIKNLSNNQYNPFIYIVFTSLVLFSCSIFSSFSEQYYCDTLYATQFTEKDGLCNSSVNDIIEDNKGRIWVGTDNYVSYYENNKWKTITTKDGLVSSAVYGLSQDSSGVYWFATANGGVCSFDGKKWVAHDTSKGLLSMSCLDIAVDKKQRIWCTHPTAGASMFDGKKWTTFDEKEMVENWTRDVMVDSKGTVWIAHAGGGISSFDGESWKLHVDNMVGSAVSVYIDQYDTIWYGTRQYGAYKYVNNESILFLDTSNGLPGDKNYAGYMLKDSKNRIWLQAVQFGLVMVDREHIRVFDSSNSIICNNPRTPIEDSRGNIWIASNGVVRLSNTTAIKGSHSIPLLHNNPNIKIKVIENKLKLSILSKYTQKVDITCYTLNGMRILHKNITISKGNNYININTSRFSFGQYLLFVKTTNGQRFAKKISLYQ
jgi:ligand-binding sensor domain-containing protein